MPPASRLPALADDSGIEVDALDGRPGVWSARYAGAQASDAENNALLLPSWRACPPQRRGARYRCVLVLVRDAADTAPLIASGVWEGRRAAAARATGALAMTRCSARGL